MKTIMRWQHLDRKRGVYLVGFGVYVKIGWSARVGARLRALEVGIPEHLTLYRIIEGATIQDEHELHRRFDALRCRNGEWFRNEPPLTGFLGNSTIPVDYRDMPKQGEKVACPKPQLYVASSR